MKKRKTGTKHTKKLSGKNDVENATHIQHELSPSLSPSFIRMFVLLVRAASIS